MDSTGDAGHSEIAYLRIRVSDYVGRVLHRLGSPRVPILEDRLPPLSQGSADSGRVADTICIHSGRFHCDDVLSVAMLLCIPRFQQYSIIRSRSSSIVPRCSIVCDVGGRYDPDEGYFDHHQREFDECMEEFGRGTKLSSAGLIWRHFGEEILQSISSDLHDSQSHSSLHREMENREVELARRFVYKYFIENVDAIDNGLPQCDGLPSYEVTTSLPDRIAKIRSTYDILSSPQAMEAGFRAALDLVTAEFVQMIEFVLSEWLPRYDEVRQAFLSRFFVHPSGGLISLVSRPEYWMDIVYELEREFKCEKTIKFSLYPGWCIRAVTEENQSFVNRMSLPDAWCGLKGKALSAAVGVPGCTYSHATGFILGNETEEGIMECFDRLLDYYEDRDAYPPELVNVRHRDRVDCLDHDNLGDVELPQQASCSSLHIEHLFLTKSKSSFFLVDESTLDEFGSTLFAIQRSPSVELVDTQSEDNGDESIK